MELSNELKDFIITFCKEWKIRNIDIDAINLETSIDLDLNIFDLDMDNFIYDFAVKFKIDMTTFSWKNKFQYPCDEDMGIVYIFFRTFNYKKPWVKKICAKYYTPKIYVKYFQFAIDNGYFETSNNK